MKYLVLVFILFTYGSQITASYDIEPKLLRLADIGENKSVYWDSNNNIYYGSVSVTKTNGINYHFDPIKSTNYIYYTNKYKGTDDYELHDSHIYKYVGSLSLLERVYIDTNNPPQLYLKILKPIDDSIFMSYTRKEYSNTFTIYPFIRELYTNNQGNRFYRDDTYTIYQLNAIDIE